MAEEKKAFKSQHNVIMESRKTLTVSGVMDIDSFDEESIVIFTELGELTVSGNNLHINKIDVDTGDLFKSRSEYSDVESIIMISNKLTLRF